MSKGRLGLRIVGALFLRRRQFAGPPRDQRIVFQIAAFIRLDEAFATQDVFLRLVTGGDLYITGSDQGGPGLLQWEICRQVSWLESKPG